MTARPASPHPPGTPMHASSHPAPPSPAGARVFLELEDVARCPVCESPGGRARFLPDVSQCPTCRVLYRSPRPTQREIVRSYDAGTTYARWQDERPVRDLLWRKRLRTIARFRPSGDLLDIGTGDGEFLRHAAGAYAVRCTEVSAAGADHVRRRGFEPQIGDFLALDVPEASFDVVTLWHVLEHVPWPGRVLAKVEATLRPGGIVAVAVPNERRPLLWRRRKKRPLGTLGWGEEIHLTHFVPTTLRRTMARVGLRVLEFGVDDVELERSFATGLAHQAHRLVSAVTGWHLARRTHEPTRSGRRLRPGRDAGPVGDSMGVATRRPLLGVVPEHAVVASDARPGRIREPRRGPDVRSAPGGPRLS